LEKTLYSMLLLGYLGILGDVRSSMFIEASRKMQEYLELRHRRSTKTNSTAEDSENIRKGAEMEANLREQLHQTLSGMRPVTP